jgi:hypothetical protein
MNRAAPVLLASLLAGCGGGGLFVDDAADTWIKCYHVDGFISAGGGIVQATAQGSGEMHTFGVVSGGTIPPEAFTKMVDKCPAGDRTTNSGVLTP